MRRWIVVVTGLFIISGAVGVAAAAIQAAGEAFPHEDHEGLFPLCTGCHSDMQQGNRAAYYPETASCANCHDDVDLKAVVWEVPDRLPTNLSFDHAVHIDTVSAAGDEALGCADCHVDPAGGRMSMDGTPPQRCLTCHESPETAPTHVENADCALCHVPLAESGLPPARMTELLVPTVHEGDDFVLQEHGTNALSDVVRCATCHVQDQCAQCHVNTGLAPIPEVPGAPPQLVFTPMEPNYPIPASHQESDFLLGHDLDAGIENCGTCHTQDDCASCHVADPNARVAELPMAASVTAPGVHLERTEPGSHGSPFFTQAHGILSAGGAEGCTTCHTQPECAACHDAAQSNLFHAENFFSRHAADAFGQTAECATCHNAQVFCRTCHQEAGFESDGRLGPAYHDAEPLWLLRHGQAARQTLEACASCHEQSDCTQCHSVLGAFKVSPHGSDFDAERARAKNPQICFACHLTVPGGGGSP